MSPLPVTTTKPEDVERWLDYASAGDVIRYSRFNGPHYALWQDAFTRSELNRLEARLNYSDMLFVCGEKRGYVILTEEMFNELTAEKKPTLEDDHVQS